MAEMCFLKESSESKMTPRFRTCGVGVIFEFWNIIVDEASLARCCGVPMIRNSVLFGLTVNRLEENQEHRESSVDEITEELSENSFAEKEI